MLELSKVSLKQIDLMPSKLRPHKHWPNQLGKLLIDRRTQSNSTNATACGHRWVSAESGLAQFVRRNTYICNC